MEEEWPYPLLNKEIDARHRAKKISDGNSCSSQAVLIPRTAGWCGIDPRWKPRCINGFHFLTLLLRFMQTDIAGELVRDAKTLWEKFRDGIVSTNQEVMAAVDSLRRKGTSQGIPTIPQLSADFIGQGGFTSLGGPTQSVPLHAPTYGTNPWQGQSMDYGGSFRPKLMSGFRPYTAS
uniref:Uncharacterized protein n=1 Tax=Oryza nivara TaxID=4536 RepID=A0A0E0FMQ2_ORYNI